MRTVIVDSTVTARMPRSAVVDNARIRAGDVIVGLASFGQATYESEYNGGMGSNGLTSGLYGGDFAMRDWVVCVWSNEQIYVCKSRICCEFPTTASNCYTRVKSILRVWDDFFAARHDVFHHALATKYPESFDPSIDDKLVYSGSKSLLDIEPTTGLTVGKLVLSPTRTYAPIVCEILKRLPTNGQGNDSDPIHGMVHCSGGGQTKILHFIDGVHVVKDNLFATPPLFALIQQESGTEWKEMCEKQYFLEYLEFFPRAPLLLSRSVLVTFSFRFFLLLFFESISGTRCSTWVIVSRSTSRPSTRKPSSTSRAPSESTPRWWVASNPCQPAPVRRLRKSQFRHRTAHSSTFEPLMRF